MTSATSPLRPPAPVASRLRPGFTLVELLVVIGILAVLAAVLFPVVAASRESGRTSRCVSNLRQLHLAFQLYATDHNGLVPPYQNRIGSRYGESEGGPEVPLPERGRELVSAVAPYTRSDQLWFCPNDRFARTASTEGNLRHQYASYRTGLGWTWWLGPVEAGKPGKQLTMDGPVAADGATHPSVEGMLTDNLWHVPADPDEKERAYSHGGRYNFLFFDGHVKAYRRTDQECPWD